MKAKTQWRHLLMFVFGIIFGLGIGGFLKGGAAGLTPSSTVLAGFCTAVGLAGLVFLWLPFSKEDRN